MRRCIAKSDSSESASTTDMKSYMFCTAKVKSQYIGTKKIPASIIFG